MDIKGEFKNWFQIPQNLSNKSTELSIFNNKKNKPNLYKVCLIFNQNILDITYYKIFKSFFKICNSETENYLSYLKNLGKISFGPYTREIAEHKITLIKRSTYKEGLTLKCKMIKDDENVIKKS